MEKALGKNVYVKVRLNMNFLLTLAVCTWVLSYSFAYAVDTFEIDESVQTTVEEYTNYEGLPTGSEPPVSASGEGRIYFNSTDNEFKASENGGAYAPFGGGGSGDFSDGGDSEGAARTLGNNDDFDMGFLVGGNPEIHVEGEAGAAQGRVGISDTGPDARLEVSGSGTTEDLFMLSTDDGNDGDVLIVEDTGEVGINGSATAASSTALFNVTDGAVLFTGSTGATPVSGAGVRMMWIPGKTAFRAGQSVATEWDDANIGSGSISMGILTEASAVNSVAIGPNSEATGATAVALGQSSLATDVSAIAIGNATASGERSLALGELVTAGPADDSYVIGRGISQAVQLVNNQQNTMAFGFNSDTPTLFIGASTGAGTTGDIGIAGVTTPATEIDMNGAITIRAGTAPTEVASQGHIYYDSTDDRFKGSEDQNNFMNIIGADPDSSATFPTCNAGRHGYLKVDSAAGGGLVYVCDPVRNKWLTLTDTVVHGEDTAACDAGDNMNEDVDCVASVGNNVGGGDVANNTGFYLPRDITITGYGFSTDTDVCTGGDTLDLEIWGTGSNSNDIDHIDPTGGPTTSSLVLASGLTSDTENANDLDLDLDGDQYIIWGLRNEGGCGAIDDWVLNLYFRYRHD